MGEAAPTGWLGVGRPVGPPVPWPRDMHRALPAPGRVSSSPTSRGVPSTVFGALDAGGVPGSGPAGSGCFSAAPAWLRHGETTSPRLQHLDGRFHWLKEQVIFDKSVSLHYVPTDDQCADCLTKNLSRTKVRRFAAALNGSSPLALPIDSPPGRVGNSLLHPSSFPSLDLL